MSVLYEYVECSDGPINSQEYKSFEILFCHYQDIYD